MLICAAGTSTSRLHRTAGPRSDAEITVESYCCSVKPVSNRHRHSCSPHPVVIPPPTRRHSCLSRFVIPAKAGIQRGGARVGQPHHQPPSHHPTARTPPYRRFANHFSPRATAPFPPRPALRYPPRMERHAPNANPAPMVRINDRAPFGSHKQGIVFAGHKFLGFVAAMRHNGYKIRLPQQASLSYAARDVNPPLHCPFRALSRHGTRGNS